MTIPKLIPILALTAITTLAPTNKAEAWWGRGGWHGWRWWGPAVAVGVPLTIAATRPYYYGYGPYYPYYGGRYYYRGGYSVSASVQARLAAKGYYHGPVDGHIGPVSREAIRAYQARHGLPATGHIDPPLLHALRLG